MTTPPKAVKSHIIYIFLSETTYNVYYCLVTVLPIPLHGKDEVDVDILFCTNGGKPYMTVPC